MDLSYDAFDVRTRTTLVCGALALVIAISALLQSRVQRAHWLFAAFAGDIGLSYLAQSLFGFLRANGGRGQHRQGRYEQPNLSRWFHRREL